MAIVKWNSAIDYVKGALTKPKKQDGHSHGDYLIGTHREAPTQNPNCTRAYVRAAEAYKRVGDINEDEQAARTRFGVVSALVAQRKKNLATMSTDQAGFLAQKDTPGGKKTFVAYLWMVVGAAYDAEHNG